MTVGTQEEDPSVGSAAVARRRSRHHDAARHAVEADLIATHTAAKAFLLGEWAGALLMAFSFTQLYLVGLGPVHVDWRLSIGGGLLMLALGGWMFWSNRVYYQRLDFPWRKKWETAATVVAGSGVIFWLLFALLAVLAAGGVGMV